MNERSSSSPRELTDVLVEMRVPSDAMWSRPTRRTLCKNPKYPTSIVESPPLPTDALCKPLPMLCHELCSLLPNAAASPGEKLPSLGEKLPSLLHPPYPPALPHIELPEKQGARPCSPSEKNQDGLHARDNNTYARRTLITVAELLHGPCAKQEHIAVVAATQRKRKLGTSPGSIVDRLMLPQKSAKIGDDAGWAFFTDVATMTCHDTYMS